MMAQASESGVPHCMGAARVAVIGAGVAGSTFAFELSRRARAAGVPAPRVELFEMGRAPGGRASTRRTREFPTFAADHGAPFFHASDLNVLALLQRLQQISPPAVEPFHRAEIVDVRATRSTATTTWVTTSRSAKCKEGSSAQANDVSGSSFVGRPTMAGLCEQMVKSSGATTRFQTVVRRVEWQANECVWELGGGDSGLEPLGAFDVLCVASATPAHTRWSSVFGGEPPVVRAAELLKTPNPALEEALRKISAVKAKPVLALVLAFDGAAASAWNALPWTVAEVHGDDVLGRVIIGRHGAAQGLISLVLHSTHEFAMHHASAGYGRGSAAERIGGASKGCSDAREQVEQSLLESLARVGVPAWVRAEHASRDSAVYGPLMHRWGGALPERPALTHSAAVIPALKLVFAGDYVGEEVSAKGEELSFVERALSSGLHAAGSASEMLRWQKNSAL